MKFELPESKVRINKKKRTIEMPADLFSDLIVYVEDLEAKLLARDINLREIDELCKKLGIQEKIKMHLLGLEEIK